MQLIFSKSRYNLSTYEFTVLELTVNQEGQLYFWVWGGLAQRSRTFQR